MAEITQEQREQEMLFERVADLVQFGRDMRTTRVVFDTADVNELLRLARLATPELVALGERAKEWAERTGRGKTTIVERDRLLSAARLYAQSIKGEDHGK